MKASKFSEARRRSFLKPGADGMPVADICRKAGISHATYFNWKKKYDGLLPTEMLRLIVLTGGVQGVFEFRRGAQWKVVGLTVVPVLSAPPTSGADRTRGYS